MNATPEADTPPTTRPVDDSATAKSREAAQRLADLFVTGVGDRAQARDDVRLLCAAFEIELCDGGCNEDWSVSLPSLRFAEAEEARARAMRGDIAEAVIHLERALPEEFAIIAEKIGDHLRSIAR